MQNTTLNLAHDSTVSKTAGERPDQPAVIAVRKRCDADGVGLSHYILMDRKPA